MIHAWVDSWSSVLFTTSWQGAIAVSVVWLLCRIPNGLSPRVQCWLWRLVAVKLLLSLFCLAPVRLPLLPAAQRVIAEPMAIPIAFATNAPIPEVSPAPAIAPAAPAAPFPWRMILAALWLTGVLLGIARVGLGWRQSRRLCDLSTAIADPVLLQVRDRLCGTMRIARPPAIARNDSIPGPMLIGILHPTILFPAKFSSDGIDMILAHELAHLRRRDLWWGWLTALIGAIYFFHPLVYFLRRELRRAEEAACDSLALCVTGKDPRDYGQMLLSLVASQSRRFQRQIFTAGIVESAATLRSRLRLLSKAGEMSRRAVVLSALSTTLIALAGLVPWQFVSKSLAADTTQPADTQSAPVTGKVLDADGKPAVGATVWAFGRRQITEPALFVSAPVASDGTFSIIPPVNIPISNAPPDPAAFPWPHGAIFAEIPGVGISQSMQLAYRTSAPLQLFPSSSLHLTLLNPDGTPDIGVAVHTLGVTGPVAVAASRDDRGVSFPDAMDAQWTVKTDSNGTCVIMGLPRTDRVLLEVDDPRYASFQSLDQLIPLTDAPVTSVSITMSSAGSISGNVVYADGKPAGKTKLILVQRFRKPIVTDDKGHFEIHRLQPGAYIINLDTTIQSRIISTNPPVIAPLDWVAQPIPIRLAAGESKTADMTLIRGGIITGKVSDKATGKGIPHADILCSPDANQALTDADGVYSLRVLPGAKTIQFNGRPLDYLPPGSPRKITVADGKTLTLNYELTPDPTPIVDGKAIDGSGNPVAGAVVFWVSPTPNASPRRAVTDAQGNFHLRAPAGTTLIARFDELATATPMTIDGSGNPVSLQISAGNTYSLVATITDEQGAPISNANVRLMDGFGGSVGGTQAQQSAADGTARFDGIATDLTSRLWISADGYANDDYVPVSASTPHQQQSLTLVLKKTTSTIAGVVVDENGAPAANAPVSFTQTGKQAVVVRTDAQGHFSFAVVDDAQGTLLVTKVVATIDGGTMYYRDSPVSAHAGQTDLKLQLPKTGP